MTTSAHIVISHQDLIVLTTWMAGEGYTADLIAEAVRKPWNYQPEILLAKAAFDAYRDLS
jgi:hypothetical protein